METSPERTETPSTETPSTHGWAHILIPVLWIVVALQIFRLVTDIDLVWWQRALIFLPALLLLGWLLDWMAARPGDSRPARAARRIARIMMLGNAPRRS
jgi:hypothetical protein